MSVTLFDLLGIARTVADRAGAAKSLWPAKFASLTQGLNASFGDGDVLTLVNQLNAGATFSNIRPGVDAKAALGTGAAGQIAFAADMAVSGPSATSQPFYLHALPDLGIRLKVTDPLHPARVYAAVDGRGYEAIIDRLPITLILKSGLASSLTSAAVTVGTFDGTAVDSFAYTLGDAETSATIDCFVRLHLTPEGDLILEPTVPLSFGPVRWMGLPAKAVHDIQILPSPNRREYLEWTHNDPGSFFSNPPAKGAIGFRSIDLDTSRPPLSDLAKRLGDGAVHADKVDLVMEDVVLPAVVPGLPLPSHGTFGFRRKITEPSDIKAAYALDGAPVEVKVYSSGAQGGNGGTTLTLSIDEFFFRTGQLHPVDLADLPQVQFKAALVYQNGTGPKLAGTAGIDDDWTLAFGFAMEPTATPVKMTIADTTIGLVGVKFGLSIGRLARALPFKDSYEVLADLYVQGAPPKPGKLDDFFKITSLTGKPLSVVLHEIGWKLGHLSLNALQMPDGMQLVFANLVHVIIEEMGWVEEPNGTPYFSFSGGVAIGTAGGRAAAPDGSASEIRGSGFGIQVRRLRFRLNKDDSQPLFKIDGIFLKLTYAPVVDVEGFGYITDATDNGWAIREWGFGVKVELNAMAMEFSLKAMFLKGSRQNLADPSQNFSYFLAALELGYLPAGPVGLYDIRALIADNMAPNLDSTFPDGEGMALLKWHQTHDHALTMPANRTLADWVAEKDAFAIGVGCGFSLNGAGSAVHLSVFIFFDKSPEEIGLLVVGELYLLKNPKPVAFVAIEYDIDREKFGVMAGVDLSLGDFASGSLPGWLANIARLSGSIYFGNQPWSFAIGQLADQSTWLSLIIEYGIWIKAKFQLGVCVQIVDGGPKGFGVIATLSAGDDWGVGGFRIWGTFGLVIGTWKTGSDSSGLEFWIGLGFKINLFWVFSFGAEVNFKLTYLGRHPWYLTLHAEIKIDTPWFLPDVTVSFDKTWQEPLPFDTASTNQPLSSGDAIDPAAQEAIALLAPGLQGALGDAGFLYSFNQINGLSGIRLGDTHGLDLPTVSVDATIVINFTQPVSNDTLIATSTYAGGVDAGVQSVQDLSLRYGLRAVAIRRAPRFGSTAGQWTDMLAASDTQFSVGGVAPQTITFAWDTDQRADGRMSPRRLLINSSAPYSFATAGAQNDEEAVRNDPDLPCCDPVDRRKLIPRPHVLEFSAVAFGNRTPGVERFSGANGAWWHWTGTPPAVVPGDPVLPGVHAARLAPRSSVLLGTVDLPDPASAASLTLAWDPLPGKLLFEGYTGLDLVGVGSVDLHEPGSTTLSLAMPAKGAGFSRLVLRVELAAGANPAAVTSTRSTQSAIRIARVSYVSLADALAYAAAGQRCKGGSPLGPPGSDASGKLAFLPNHDYEVVLTTAVRVGSKSQGSRETLLTEAVYFRTKGLPGLNAVPNPGDDIRPHVAAIYPPRRMTPLYRQEPCVLAFEDALSSVLPIDRTPSPGSPPEQAQMFPLELNVDRVASLDGMKRLTVPSGDWILAHRGNPYPVRVWPAGSGFATAKVRKARTADAMVLRHLRAKIAVGTCGPQTPDHASQVLLHEPIGAGGEPGVWEGQTGYRATVRQKDGPFAERSGFDMFDLHAFIRQADGAAAVQPWSVGPHGTLVSPAAGDGRHYASCGEPGWDHLQVHARIDLGTAALAGIAVGVGDGTPVPRAVLATVEAGPGGRALVLRTTLAGVDTVLATTPVTVAGPFLLTVTAFDDKVRAAVGDTSIEAPRGAFREGRVALVAQGASSFGGISVGALDIYTFEFVTSRYRTFAEHVGSYDGKLPVLATGAFGSAPVTAAAVLAAQGGGIPAAMVAEADPQARQALFSGIVGALGIGLSATPRTLTLARLTDAAGTAGFVMQSPEPISFTRDVKVVAMRHVRTWVWDSRPIFVPGPLPLHPLRPASAVSVGDVSRLALAAQGQSVAEAALERALPELRFDGAVATLPPGAGALPEGGLVARVVAGEGGDTVEIFATPGARAGLRQSVLTPAQAAARPDLGALAGVPAGSIGLLTPGGWHWGHWNQSDVLTPLTVLTNGDETTALLIAPLGASLPAGTYRLHLVLERDRWPASGTPDPEQHYHDEAVLAAAW